MIASYVLLTDGSSDRLLLRPIDWLLRQSSRLVFEGEWADPRGFRSRPKGLPDRIRAALDAYPCDLLFVHRDAEKAPRETRVDEVREALARVSAPPAVCVIPVRMTEAWFLFDRAAIRRAAGNPRSTEALDLPPVERIEFEVDPKRRLVDALTRASGLTGRRLARFHPLAARARVADLIDDCSPLDDVPAFRAFRHDLRQVLAENDWAGWH